MHDQHTPQPTIISFLLDRLGRCPRSRMRRSGVQRLLDTLEREVGDLVEFTLLQFDSKSIDTLCTDAKVSAAERQTPETYQAAGLYALIDACFNTIKLTEGAVARRRDKPRVIVVFQTNGEENASREYKLDELSDLIERRRAEGGNSFSWAPTSTPTPQPKVSRC